MISRALVLSIVIGSVATQLGNVGNASAQQLVNPAEVMSDMLRREQARRPPQPVRPPALPEKPFDPASVGTLVTHVDPTPGPMPTKEQIEQNWQRIVHQMEEAARQDYERQQTIQRQHEQELRSPPRPPPTTCTTMSLGGGDFSIDCF
jgi:hypothetical protein